MRRRRRRASREDAVIKIGNGIELGFPVRAKLIEYADRLLGRHNLTPRFLQFVLSLLSIGARRRLVEYLYLENSTRGHSGLYEEHIEELYDEETLAYDIIRDINSHKINIKKGKLDKFLGRLWSDEYGTGRDFDGGVFAKEVSNLKNLFQLKEDEMEILFLLYCYTQDATFENLCNGYKLPEYLNFISAVTGISLTRVTKALGKKGKLIQAGVIGDNDVRHTPYYSLSDEIVEYLSGMTDTPLAEKYCRTDTGTTYAVGSFNIPEAKINIIRSLLSSTMPCHILLYGEAGTGKTEFARAVVAVCRKQAFFVQYGEDGDVSARRLALHAATATVPPDRGVLIVDEADTLLNTRYMFLTTRDTMEKGWLNDFFDHVRTKVIWITNERQFMETSLLRRFSYSLHFKKFTGRERENVWINLTAKHPLKRFLTRDDIRKLAAKYEVNAAGIASALDAVKSILSPKNADEKTVREMLEELLTRHEELIGQGFKRPLNSLTNRYDISALNVDVEINLLLQAARAFAGRDSEKAQEERGSLNLLFWGRPGTGKTEFVKYLAAELGMPLIIKRASELVSMWLGETEKNIRDAFDEAEREKAVLFLDEADSFFINRESAHRSWEVSQTNELLTQMENYRGILICCTNLLYNLDKAAMRRFQWKVEFKPLTREGRVSLYQKYFGTARRRLTPEQKGRITDINNLTPGDIKAVWQRYRFSSGKAVSHDNIIGAIEKEVEYRGESPKPKIGFGR
ncbi:MAG: AAA family ATPase [Thermodesulfobacteriota bacterium]|nr:AAA family ATPase [Thermodesulfobacteriota bacterium]